LLLEIERHLPPRGLRFALPRSQIGRDVLRDGLLAAGAEVDAVVAYHTLPPREADARLVREIAAGAVPVLSFTSPSTVRNLVASLDAEAREALGTALVAAVGPTTAEAVEREGLRAEVVPAVSGGLALVSALAQFARANPDRIAALRERQASALAALQGASASSPSAASAGDPAAASREPGA
jgi:uroporphyrinogen III methyltransferase/synthase